MYEDILLLFILISVIFTFIIAIVMNAKIDELEECYNNLYTKIKKLEDKGV
jgi:hypothetical protein